MERTEIERQIVVVDRNLAAIEVDADTHAHIKELAAEGRFRLKQSRDFLAANDIPRAQFGLWWGVTLLGCAQSHLEAALEFMRMVDETARKAGLLP